jgi:nucleolysin TIA-1/TIAR
MWDPDTGRSRGYGFVTFRVRQNAERAFQEMSGSFLGGRAIKVNWANNKKAGNEPESDPSAAMKEIQSGNRVVYVGNLGPDVTSEALQLKFRDIGPLENVKVTPDKGYAFVTYQTSSDAARAIETFNGDYMGSRPMKCGWGKVKDASSQSQVVTPTMLLAQQMGVSPQQLATYMNAGYMPNMMQYPYAYPGGAANPQLQMQQQYQQQIPLQQQVPLQQQQLQQQLYQQQLLQQQQMQMQMQQPQQQSYNPQSGYTPVANYNANYTASYPHNSGHPY